uniref:uncharacterized protein LOC105349735 n=1 Tax=Fragaria vesca subsp. vesca TaxID=101020 RepID=UPI0005C87DD8|nr:PREDICTED: uncharacterized protein LOC105349735 [Fragaria vesca subsp. vesca]
MASSRPSRPPCDSSLKSGALEKKNRRRRRETVFADESPIPTASTPLTGMDSFISISETFPCSWCSKKSSEEGESNRRNSGIFPVRAQCFSATSEFDSGCYMMFQIFTLRKEVFYSTVEAMKTKLDEQHIETERLKAEAEKEREKSC